MVTGSEPGSYDHDNRGAKFESEIRVEHEGRLESIGSKYLGACLGHRSQLGAGVALAPGRALPNDVVLVGPPGSIAKTMPEHGGHGPMTIRDGRVVPLDPSTVPVVSDDQT